MRFKITGGIEKKMLRLGWKHTKEVIPEGFTDISFMGEVEFTKPITRTPPPQSICLGGGSVSLEQQERMEDVLDTIRTLEQQLSELVGIL